MEAETKLFYDKKRNAGRLYIPKKILETIGINQGGRVKLKTIKKDIKVTIKNESRKEEKPTP